VSVSRRSETHDGVVHEYIVNSGNNDIEIDYEWIVDCRQERSRHTGTAALTPGEEMLLGTYDPRECKAQITIETRRPR